MENNQKPENSEEYNGILGDYQEQEESAPEVQETDSAPKKGNPLKIAGIALVSAALLGGLGFLGGKMTSQPTEEPSSQAEAGDSALSTEGETADLSSLPDNTTAAMYSENFEISPSLMNCFYDEYLNQYSSILTTYYDIDPATTSLKDHKLPEDSGEDMTWFEFIMEEAQNMASRLLLFQEAANADGYTLTEEDQQTIEKELAAVDLSTYGGNVTKEDVRAMIELEVLASSYVNHVMENIELTDEELEAYYQENTKAFDSCSLMGFNVYYQTEDETAESEVEEETKMPQEQAKKLADNLLKASTPEDFETQVRDILLNNENYEEADLENLSSSIRADGFTYTEGFEAAEWAFSGTSKAGETHLVEGDGYYSVYLLVSEPAREDTSAVDVRHILFMTDNHLEENQAQEDTDAESSDETAESETELSEEEQDAAEQKALELCHTYAENLLNEWQNGEASEDSFAELANEYSEDPGSNTKGGLYEDVAPGQMVAEFNDWCFDPSRKPGDAGIVETSYGVHVMYFSKTGEPVWKSTASEEIKNNRMNTWFEEVHSTYAIATNDDVINSIEG